MNFGEWFQMLRLVKGQKLRDVELTPDNAIVALHFDSIVISICKEDFIKLCISPSVTVDRLDELDYGDNNIIDMIETPDGRKWIYDIMSGWVEVTNTMKGNFTKIG